MKLIDEKGRLFGKFNIIDLLIVLIVLGGLFGVNYKLGLIKKMGGDVSTTQQASVKFGIKQVTQYTANAINEGDTLVETRNNTPIGKIVKKEVRPFKETASDANGKWVISEMPERYEVILTVDAVGNTVNGALKVGSRDIKVGAQMEIAGSNFQTQSYVYEVK